jgi:NAD(P)H dehydrogenase (quinone)
MPKVLVLFYSRTGKTASLADAIAEGAGSVKFTEVEIRRVEDLGSPAASDADDSSNVARAALAKKYRVLESVDSLTQYDALVIGGPVRHGVMSAELTHTLDQARALAERGALVDKVGSVFGSAPAEGSHDTDIIAMLRPLMHFGMIIVPPGSGDRAAAAMDDLAAARKQGARVAKVAEWVRHAKSHEAHGHRH